MHKNNPKMAQKYWALVESGVQISDATNSFQIQRNDGKWYNLNPFTVPNFTCHEEIRKKPAHWLYMQEYERKAQNNVHEYLNWLEYIPSNGWIRCLQRPDFESDHKRFERKEITSELLKMIATYKENSEKDKHEWRNWEWMHTEKTGGKWKPWARNYTLEQSFLLDDGTQYRRKLEPVSDANGWFTIDSVPIEVPVDLYNCKAINPERIIDQIIIAVEYDDNHRCLNSNSKVIYATHWRPATPAPSPVQNEQEQSPKYGTYEIEIICNGVTLKEKEYNCLIGEELDPYFARDVFKVLGFDKNDGWKKWQFKKYGSNEWQDWYEDFDALDRCWRKDYTYRINPNLK